MQYNPTPPRVWSRVQNQCTNALDTTYKSVFVPLNSETVPVVVANYQEKILYKGNILQYKKNSSNLTKNQRFAQISKGCGANRTKTFATQSQTYSNPNTTGLQRVNYTTFPYPNNIVGAPNNVSGPFQYNVPNPDDCSGNSVQSGGSLICNKYANPCTGEIIKQTQTTNCYPTTCSDVPGQIQDLCWDNRLQTYYPRQRYFMSNSGSKWPEGYKGFVSAIVPVAPVLTLLNTDDSSATLSWTDIIYKCLPVSSYNIFQNGSLVRTVDYTVTNITITGLEYSTQYSFFVIALSTAIRSSPSNIVSTTTWPKYAPVLSLTFSCYHVRLTWTDENNNAGTAAGNLDYTIYQDGELLMSSVPYSTKSIYVDNIDYDSVYSYYIVANSGGHSVESNTEGGTASKLAPPYLNKLTFTDDDVTLKWTETTCFNDVSFNIYQYQIDDDTGAFINEVEYTAVEYTKAKTTYSYTIFNLQPRKLYYLKVKAYMSQVQDDISKTFESDYSRILSGTTVQITTPKFESAVFSCQKVTLTWTESANALYTDVYYNITQTGTSNANYITDASSIVIDLSYSAPYTFTVYAFEDEEVYSNDSTAVSGNTSTLYSPTDLAASVLCNNITLTWTDDAIFCDDMPTYNIIQQTGLFITTYINKVSPYIIEDLSYGALYDFKVQAFVSQDISSNYSTTVSATTVSITTPFAPQLTLLAVTDPAATVTLTWTDTSNNDATCFPITSYNIYQNGTPIPTIDLLALTYTIDVSADTQYSYYVTAYSENSTLYSSASNTMTTLDTQTLYWYLDDSLLKCGYKISVPKVTRLADIPLSFQKVVQPSIPWILSGDTLTSIYNIIVTKSVISSGNTGDTLNTNYWYFTDATTKDTIYANYPIYTLSITTTPIP